MPAIKFINRLKTIDQLIRFKITGSPKELADKLEISERQLFRYIDNLHELGATNEFDKIQNRYIYKTDIELLITFPSKK